MRFIPLLVISVCITFQANATVGNESPLLFDRFSHIRCTEEVARLENYGRALKEAPNTTGVIIGYGGRRDTRRGEIAARLFSAKAYLAKTSKIDKNRIVILNGGYRESLNIELWIITTPNREDAPLLISSTVKSEDVRLKKARIEKRDYKCNER